MNACCQVCGTPHNIRCAACGAIDGIEMHHVIPVVLGGVDGPVVPLCGLCHGKAHEVRRAIDIGSLTRSALAAARARGQSLGGYRLAAAEATKARGDATVKRAALAIAAAKDAGCTSLRSMAEHMTASGCPAPRGGAWTAQSVRRLMMRARA